MAAIDEWNALSIQTRRHLTDRAIGIFQAALDERRAGEVLYRLFAGDTPAIHEGRLVFMDNDQVQQLAGEIQTAEDVDNIVNERINDGG